MKGFTLNQKNLKSTPEKNPSEEKKKEKSMYEHLNAKDRMMKTATASMITRSKKINMGN
ncbi:hypothetical protein NC653_029016 [Populus alba x Populus x berolinensis]|uniref:Uncharacterized protein n=1 Tax=Populus alba x Populus x berolinensis TaxID=444605 RepID=A0AAD6M1C4_9ROSI|nr:hypothetical protein NC653_029016 [Populus alba x Populus x berolinensis]